MRKHAEILADGFLGKFAEFDRQTQAGWTRYHDRYGFEAHNPGCEVIIHWNPNWRNNDHLEDCDLRITTPDMSVNMVSGLRHAAIKDGYVIFCLANREPDATKCEDYGNIKLKIIN